MADSIGGDMIRGHIDSIILNSLLDSDKDTNQIRSEIENKAGGDFKLKQGTFYSALQRISKQGFVTEYRTSGTDGVRRKFFQLTEKGKAHIEKSQNTWSQSQTVINKLLDAEQNDTPTFTPITPVEEIKIPSFDDQPVVTDFAELSNPIDEEPVSDNPLIFGMSDEEETANETISNKTSDVLPEDLPNDDEKTAVEPTDSIVNGLLDILDSNEITGTSSSDMSVFSTYTYSVDETNPANVKTASTIENKDGQVNDAKIDDIDANNEEKESFESIVHGSDNDYDEPQYNCDISTDLFDRTPKYESVEPEENEESSTSSRNLDENALKLDDEKFEQLKIDDAVHSSIDDAVHSSTENKTAPISKSNAETSDDSDGIDDFIANVDEMPEDRYPDQPSYKDILSRIIEKTASKNEPAAEPPRYEETSKVVEFPQVNREESSPEPETPVSDIYVDKIDFNEPEHKTESVFTENRKPENGTLRPKKGFDYSDIITMSEEEGFKVSTSDNTNKSELGKILLNKLNFHASSLFFIIVALETLIVGLTMNGVLNFPTYSYFLFGLGVFIFPLVSGIIYYISPKRAVAEIRTFKSSFETALIITLELLIAILMVTVIRNLDFSNYPDVARTLFVPLLIVINVPIYVIIKYSLLDRQSYYS